MSPPRWLASITFLAFGASACSSSKPELAQPVGLTTITSASERAPERQPRAGGSESQAPIASAQEHDRCSGLLPSFLFGPNSVVISPGQNEELRRIADCMTTGALQRASVVVLGHSDDVGAQLYNLGLGLDRALEVRAFLIAHGAPASQVITATSGELSTPADWPGRRVDLLVVPSPAPGSRTPAPIGPEPTAVRSPIACVPPSGH